MILHKKWGEVLRMGNFMFKYASLLGLSKRYDTELVIPNHYMFDYFENKIKIDENLPYDKEITERNFFYDIDFFDSISDDIKSKNINFTLSTFLQSYKYWEEHKDYVHSMLRFKPSEIDKIKKKYSEALSKKTIGISIRRGDFVNHGTFFQINLDFYLKSLNDYFPNIEEYNIIAFCDDYSWIRQNLKLDNVYYADGDFVGVNFKNDPFEQLILGSLCENFIIGNSTFSWWLAYLSKNCNNSNGIVIHSGKNFKGFMEQNFRKEDFYHPSWIESNFYN
jgi:hypothetical protein